MKGYIVDVLSMQMQEEALNILSGRNTPDPEQPRRKNTKQRFTNVETDTIRCICANIQSHIHESLQAGYHPPRMYDVFVKDVSDAWDPDTYSLDAIQFMFTFIHNESRMEYECMIIALIHMERLRKLTNGKFRICPLTWRYALFGCMMLASKTYDDLSMINADFASIFHNFDLPLINTIELSLLKMMDFQALVSEKEYQHMQSTIWELNLAAERDAAEMFASALCTIPGHSSIEYYIPSLPPCSGDSWGLTSIDSQDCQSSCCVEVYPTPGPASQHSPSSLPSSKVAAAPIVLSSDRRSAGSSQNDACKGRLSESRLSLKPISAAVILPSSESPKDRKSSISDRVKKFITRLPSIRSSGSSKVRISPCASADEQVAEDCAVSTNRTWRVGEHVDIQADMSDLHSAECCERTRTATIRGYFNR